MLGLRAQRNQRNDDVESKFESFKPVGSLFDNRADDVYDNLSDTIWRICNE